jgi:hypothetical protein
MSVEENGENCDLPKNVALNDDTLLQKIKFLSIDDENRNIILSKAEQSLMLSLIKFAHRFGSSSDELLNEELLSYLDFNRNFKALVNRISLFIYEKFTRKGQQT